MISFLLATALSLQPVDTARHAIPPAPLSRVYSAASPVSDRIATLSQVGRDSAQSRVFAFDKVQHFLVGYAIYSFSYAGDRVIGFSRKAALIHAFGAVIAVGAGKEVYDTRQGKRFSGYDLIADALGGVAAYAVMKQVR